MIMSFAKGELKKIKEFMTVMTKAQHAYENDIYIGYGNNNKHCLSLHDKEENPTFKLSCFTGMDNVFPPNLMQAAYNVEALKAAIKAKPVSYEINDKGEINFITNDDKPYFVGGKMEEQFDEKIYEEYISNTEFWFKALYDAVSGDKKWKRYESSLTPQDIVRLINYEVVTVRPVADENEAGYNLALIMTNKLIPNIKKLETCYIVWLACESEIFYAHIYCSYAGMKFQFENIYMAAKC